MSTARRQTVLDHRDRETGATVAGASVRGFRLAATAADNVGVSGVQFTLDGANLGAEDPPIHSTSISILGQHHSQQRWAHG